MAVMLAAGLAGCVSELDFTTASAPQDLDCPRSQEAIEGAAKRMAALVPRIKAENEAIPQTVMAVLGRLSGKPGDGTQAYADYEVERQRGESVLAKAKASGCTVAEAETQLEAAKTKLAEIRG